MINLSSTIANLTNATVTRRVQTITTVDFEEQTVNVDTTLDVVLQPAAPEKLVKAGLDSSKSHIMLHCLEPIDMGEYILYGGKTYKVVSPLDAALYGFTQVIAEEWK